MTGTKAVTGMHDRPPAPVVPVLLAAGLSRRFGDRDKLLARLDGKTVLEHSLTALIHLWAGFGTLPPLVVCSTDAQAEIALTMGVEAAVNPAPSCGLSSSLHIGINAVVRTPADWALITLADMPFVSPQALATLIAASDTGDRSGGGFEDSSGRKAGMGDDAVCFDTPALGPPVLWNRRQFKDLLATSGDQGGGQLLRRKDLRIKTCDAAGIDLRDIDTPGDLGP